MKKFLMYLTLILIIGVVGGFLYSNYLLNEKISSDNPLKVIIPKGSGTKKISKILTQSIDANPTWLYELYLKYSSFVDNKFLKAGVYLFPTGITKIEIINALFEGKYLYTARVTFPEGISYKDFASILQKKVLVDSAKFVKLCESQEVLDKYNIPSKNVDGYLLPETYEFYMESPAEEVISKLLDFHKRMFDRIQSLSSNTESLSKHEALTLASIVEAETPEESERARVAGLYLNRIKKNMLLQADPTVSYALGGKQRLLYEDLKIDNPYNTYKYSGFPPGPINNPGAKSIKAALNHEKHDYIYMVLIGDDSKKHNFSENYKLHTQYVNEYRKRIKQNNN